MPRVAFDFAQVSVTRSSASGCRIGYSVMTKEHPAFDTAVIAVRHGMGIGPGIATMKTNVEFTQITCGELFFCLVGKGGDYVSYQ